MTNTYTSEVFWSDEDEGFIAIVPDLPGCSAFGDSRIEAMAELDSAIEAWKVSAKKSGNPIPVAQPKASFGDYSGKVSLRMPKELHANLSDQARAEGMSLNSHMCYLLTKRHFSQVAVSDAVKTMDTKVAAYKVGDMETQVIQVGFSGGRKITPERSVKSTSDFIPLTEIKVQSHG